MTLLLLLNHLFNLFPQKTDLRTKQAIVFINESLKHSLTRFVLSTDSFKTKILLHFTQMHNSSAVTLFISFEEVTCTMHSDISQV